MVDDATVSLEDRGMRLCHRHGGSGGPAQLFMLSDVGVVSVPGSDVEPSVVDEEQAGAQEKQEKHRYPMALTETQTDAGKLVHVTKRDEVSAASVYSSQRTEEEQEEQEENIIIITVNATFHSHRRGAAHASK